MIAQRALRWVFKGIISDQARTPCLLPVAKSRCLQTLSQPKVNSFDSYLGPKSDAQIPNDTTGDMLKNPDYFGIRKMFTVKEMLQCGVHYGHMSGTLDHRMRQFVFGHRFDQLIFDLDMTAEYLRDALNVVSHIAYRGGIILFVCRDRQNAHLVEQTAVDCGEYAHTRYWHGGIFTNSQAIYGATTRLPDLLIFISTLNSVLEQHVGVEQAALMNIPTVGLVDTNCNPNLITYPVPGNDDSPSSVSFFCHVFKSAIQNAKRKRQENEKVTGEQNGSVARTG